MWDIFWLIVGITTLAFVFWSLIRVLKDRQASDRSYENRSEGTDVGHDVH